MAHSANKNVLMNHTIGDIVECIRNGTAIAVSNGLLKDKFSIACSIIENKSGTERIAGLIDVPGFDDEHDAYRSELAGLYGIVVAEDMIYW